MWIFRFPELANDFPQESHLGFTFPSCIILMRSSTSPWTSLTWWVFLFLDENISSQISHLKLFTNWDDSILKSKWILNQKTQWGPIFYIFLQFSDAFAKFLFKYDIIFSATNQNRGYFQNGSQLFLPRFCQPIRTSRS